jgi:hypothetical protein
MVTLLVLGSVALVAAFLWYLKWSTRKEAEMLDKYAEQFGLVRRPDESNASLRFRIETAVVTRSRKSVKYGA